MRNKKNVSLPRMAALTLASAGVALALAGCGNLSRVSAAGMTDKPVFPDVQTALLRDGTWPNLDNLRSVHAGMTKDQLYALLGPPHFGEGFVGVREWDYLFHLPAADGGMLCQYKILFDRDKVARSFYWKPEACAGALAGPA